MLTTMMTARESCTTVDDVDDDDHVGILMLHDIVPVAH